VTINDGNEITVNPHSENRKTARLRDGKCLLFTTNFEKSASEIISTYFGKDVIEKIFDCFKNWLDLQPVRHFGEGNIDVYILEEKNMIKFLCSLKSKGRLLKSWGLRMRSFRVVAYTTLKVRL
jgi:transposase